MVYSLGRFVPCSVAVLGLVGGRGGWRGRVERRTTLASVLLALGINKTRCDFSDADNSGHPRRRVTRSRQTQARISGGRCARRRRPVCAQRRNTTTASRASYAGARQLRAARDAIAAINKPRRTPPPRPDTEWATPAPASRPPCRATPRHQRAGAARRARSPTRASAWQEGAPASPRSA